MLEICSSTAGSYRRALFAWSTQDAGQTRRTTFLHDDRFWKPSRLSETDHLVVSWTIRWAVSTKGDLINSLRSVWHVLARSHLNARRTIDNTNNFMHSALRPLIILFHWWKQGDGVLDDNRSQWRGVCAGQHGSCSAIADDWRWELGGTDEKCKLGEPRNVISCISGHLWTSNASIGRHLMSQRICRAFHALGKEFQSS